MKESSSSTGFMLQRPGALATGFSQRCVAYAHVMPARLEAALRIADSSSMLGPSIGFEGSLVFSGLQASVIFRARARETDPHEDVVVRPVPLVPAGERVAVKGRPLRGIPGRSPISIRLIDRTGRPLAEDREVGQCADGVLGIHVPFQVGVGALVWVAARDWSARGPRCAVSGEVVFPMGMAMRLGFHPSGNVRSGTGEGAAELQLVPPGTAWQAPEKIVEGSSSENAWVSVQFAEPGGRPVGEEHVVGRCLVA